MSHPHIDVHRIARLARLELTEVEVASYTSQLDEIIGYIDKLSELDVSGIEPTANAIALSAPMRDDIVGTSLPASALIQNAPDHAQQQIRVPKVVTDA
jgi:aspartyl-tRNA(Asn)/glutamyl-tRNA(Gln) amidotransferase subunit C